MQHYYKQLRRYIHYRWICVWSVTFLLVACGNLTIEEPIWGSGAPLLQSSIQTTKGQIIGIQDKQLYTVNADGTAFQLLEDIHVDVSEWGGVPTISPDGRYLFVPSRDANSIIDLHDHEQSQILNSDFATYPIWSPDSTRIAYIADEKLHITTYDTSEWLTTKITVPLGSREIEWSPDQTKLAFIADLHLYTLSTSENVHFTDVNIKPVQVTSTKVGSAAHWPYDSYDWSMDSATIALADGGYVDFIPINGSNSITVTVSSDNFISWSPNGQHVIVGDQNLSIVNTDGSNVVTLTDFSALSVPYGTWSSDGSQIAFGVAPPRVQEGPLWWKLFVINRNGTQSTHVTNDDIAATSIPLWSPDDTTLLFVGGIESTPDVIGEQRIYLTRADGSAITLLVENSHWATWIPQP